MKRLVRVMLFLCAAFFMNSVNAQFAFNETSQKQMMMTNLSSMPLAFIENHGQWEEKTLFKAEGGGATFYFCKDEVAYLFVRDTDELDESPQERRQESFPDAQPIDRPRYKKEAYLIKAQFVDANPNPEVIGEGRLPQHYNYFYGNDPVKWRTDVSNYSSITYKNIWPGIDLKYHGSAKGMKYDFIVSPGADIAQIRIRYEGADNLAISNAGDLEAQTQFGLIYENIPEIYQEVSGAKVSVSGGYRLIELGVYGFAVENYNPSRVLVIDPELLYSTYLGGSDRDFGRSIAVDGSGNIYVAGYTESDDFPLADPYDGDFNGGYEDVFVSKFSPNGNSLIFSTYIGGNGEDNGLNMAIDNSGSVYVAGHTRSSNFPVVNAFDSLYHNSQDIIVLKLSTSGDSLIYSTYLGGNLVDEGYDIAVDDLGSAYITGYTYSPDFPTVNAYNDAMSSPVDVFVTKFSSTGDSLVYSTYLGGNAMEEGYGIAVDNAGSAYVSGMTNSDDFPMVNPYDGSWNDAGDVFVTKFAPGGDSLVYSTYIGGSDADYGQAITIDNSGNAFIAGHTESPDLPVVNPYDETWNNGFDAFVMKLSPNGHSLIYSTYIGGSYADKCWDIATDNSGCAYITGETYSSDFPTVAPYDGNSNGYEDVFVTKLSPTGNSLVYSTYLGGNEEDYGFGIAVDGPGNTYVTGWTFSSDYPRVSPYDNSLDGYSDVFVAKFSATTGIADDPSDLPRMYQLLGNYPSPFNAQTVIEYSLPSQSTVTIGIFDLLGRQIEVLAEGIMPAGNHQVIWDAGDRSSGIYFYKLQANDYSASRKMILLK